MSQFLNRIIGGMQHATGVLTKAGHFTKLSWKSACELISGQDQALKTRLISQVRREGTSKLVKTQVQRYWGKGKAQTQSATRKSTMRQEEPCILQDYYGSSLYLPSSKSPSLLGKVPVKELFRNRSLSIRGVGGCVTR